MEYIKSITTPAVMFMGEYDPKMYYEYGCVCTRHGSTYIFDGESWTELGEISCSTTSTPKEKTEVEIIFQCRNCGAPTREDGVCAYCGTINRKTKKFSI
jgi:hypothetical protein